MLNSFELEIQEAWDKYITEGKRLTCVSDLIFNSWERCRKRNIDPYGGIGKSVSQEELDKLLLENKELINIAIPIMNNLNSIVLGTGFVLVLTDKNGILLNVVGEKSIEERAQKINFNKGSRWSEEEVGTNAIGTCIEERTLIQTIGAEHYCKTHHTWTCSAAPIKNPEGELVGVLNMSGISDTAHKHTLGIVVAAAYSIENQLSLSQTYAMMDTTVESILDGMIIIDKDYKIRRSNKSAQRILKLDKEKLYKMDIRAILGNTIFSEKDSFQKRIDWDFVVNNKRIPCNIKINQIMMDNNLKGMAIMFREMKDVHETVNIVSGNKATYNFSNIITTSINMQKSIKEAQKFSKTKGCVLIEGESGTGKELFAHSIHNFSSRRNGPFVALNCASLPRELVESELFGYEKGAFTGAVKEGKVGKFELANGGTLFLDEIGELPFDLQAKLLRVLDDYRITRIGGKYSKTLDVRIVVATNRNLLEETRKKRFREDLYYRLNVFKVNISSLRERPEDIILLANHFLNRLNKTHGTNKLLSEDFYIRIKEYKWPGNVRELENIIERAFYLCENSLITESYLPSEIIFINNRVKQSYLSIKDKEKEVIENALKNSSGYVIQAGELLGLSKSSVYRKIKQYDINPKKYKT
ncbi:MAG: sigma-54-dependent Fis family transcriptional regulator [Gudongella sp.]|nr:sigma-54-dependent Fis family transcriptional regulator [Gudongella sp.]